MLLGATCTLDTHTRFLFECTCLPSGSVSQCHTIGKKKKRKTLLGEDISWTFMMTEKAQPSKFLVRRFVGFQS